MGKSSLINALTGQDIAIVSEIAGTTTDPVTKTMEITGIGPVVMTDTAGIDDTGELGNKRVAKTIHAMDTIDLGVIVIAENIIGDYEKNAANELIKRGTPFFVLHNKSDLAPITSATQKQITAEFHSELIDFSSLHPKNFEDLIALLRKTIPESSYKKPSIMGDLISEGDVVVLVVPIDIETPEGRIILPQVQVIRECLDNNCVAIILKEHELDTFLKTTKIEPKLVITDSQAFEKVDAEVPKNIPITSFSILFARLKGNFEKYMEGTPQISKLKDGDRVLILESCSHHVAGDDIGRVKLPRWISSFTGKKLEFDTVAGMDAPPHPITEYSLIVQCGGCMLTRKQVLMRLRPAIEQNVPVTNYGMAIAYCHGVFDRAITPFRI